MAKVHSVEFGDATGWILVNDYTIHEPKQLKDRPFMLTRVPKRLHVELHDVCAVESVEWAGDHCTGEVTVNDDGNLVASDPAKDREEGYVRKRWISGKGKFNDKITVFTIADGAVAQFRALDYVRIAPLPRGMVGGKHKATTLDGIGFSGMSSRDVPEGGLMEGEPGNLWLDDGKHERENKSETLNAELYIDEGEFDAIFEAIRDGAPNIETVHADIIAELFEGEVQASLSEWWMSHEYGMLKKGDWVQTPARVANFRVSFGGRLPVAPVDLNTFDAPEERQPEAPVTPLSPMHNAETQALLKRLHVRGGWTIAVLVALIIVTLLK